MKNLIDRLNASDPELVRIDITANMFKEWAPSQITAFLEVFPYHQSIRSIHLSGLDLESVLTTEQIEELALSIGSMDQIEDLCVFRGGSVVISEGLLSRCLHRNRNLKVLLLWQFASLHEHVVLAKAIRQHPSLERITITLPDRMPWASMDVFSMAFCEMEKLRVLQIRCQGRQTESILSPEAAALLFSSKKIESLYLENVGLIDDHVDVMAEELPKNNALTLLDVKDNLFTDDALYTIGRALPNFKTLTSLDMSGCLITQGAGDELARSLESSGEWLGRWQCSDER
jgi:Ran GTPase-activating protein (RanGAP) involved in mRNA processing and transport